MTCHLLPAAASETSAKSETLHMYGNETVSSVSVKSGGSYSREDSVADFEASFAIGAGYVFHFSCVQCCLVLPVGAF